MKKLWIMIERGRPLSAVTQVTSQVTSNQCWTTWTWTSEYLYCHILLWNKLITIVLVSSSRRSRTTLMDKIFKPNYNKPMSTTNLVRSPRKWWRTWVMHSCLNCPRQTRKRNAKSVSLLESRHRLLHLRASLERKRSQPRRHSMYIGPSLNSKLCHQEGTTSWPSVWENYSTKRSFYCT